MNAPQPGLLTVEQAAQRLSISRTKMFELIASTEIASITIGRSRRISEQALATYITQLEGGTNDDRHIS